VTCCTFVALMGAVVTIVVCDEPEGAWDKEEVVFDGVDVIIPFC